MWAWLRGCGNLLVMNIPHHDTTHKGKVYRTFVEGLSIQHPDEVIVAVFDVSLPGKPKELKRFSGREDTDLHRLQLQATEFIKAL